MAAIQRIVLFKFKDGTPSETVRDIFQRLDGLQDVIPGVSDYSSGPYASTDNLNDGFTHAFVVTFENEAARAGFGPHEAHQAAVAVLGPHLEKVLAFDFNK